MAGASEAMRRRGRRNQIAGLMAEDAVARVYREAGGEILERRCRTPWGEIDIVVLLAGILVFVEVKRRERAVPFDQLVTARQWQRLEAAATHYMIAEAEKTGAIRGCRFDLAVTGRETAPRIIENARSFETH